MEGLYGMQWCIEMEKKKMKRADQRKKERKAWGNKLSEGKPFFFFFPTYPDIHLRSKYYLLVIIVPKNTNNLLIYFGHFYPQTWRSSSPNEINVNRELFFSYAWRYPLLKELLKELPSQKYSHYKLFPVKPLHTS